MVFVFVFVDNLRGNPQEYQGSNCSTLVIMLKTQRKQRFPFLLRRMDEAHLTQYPAPILFLSTYLRPLSQSARLLERLLAGGEAFHTPGYGSNGGSSISSTSEINLTEKQQPGYSQRPPRSPHAPWLSLVRTGPRALRFFLLRTQSQRTTSCSPRRGTWARHN